MTLTRKAAPSSGAGDRPIKQGRIAKALLRAAAWVFLAVLCVGLPVRSLYASRTLSLQLTLAIEHDDYPSVVRALEQGADPNMVVRPGRSGSLRQLLRAFFTARAAEDGVPERPILLALGRRDRRGRWLGRTRLIVAALISHGADLNVVGPTGYTPVTAMFERVRVPTVQPTLVIYVYEVRENTQLLTLLLDHGADPCATTAGYSALQLASMLKLDRSVAILRSYACASMAAAKPQIPAHHDPN